MKRVYVNKKWCLGCHLCEYNCAFANSGQPDMVRALRGKTLTPNIRIEGGDAITFAVSCRHCTDPLCVKSCISGAMHKKDGAVVIDHDRCVSCYTCVLVCPYGAVVPSARGAVQKCELCLENPCQSPACASGCPNGALVYEEREV